MSSVSLENFVVPEIDKATLVGGTRSGTLHNG